MNNDKISAYPCAIFLALVMIGWNAVTAAGGSTHDGASTALGDGTVNAYVTMDGDMPVALGVRFTKAALAGLPAEPNPQSRCADMDHDGVVQTPAECLGDYELELEIPAEFAGTATPIQWIGLNWEAHGHSPPGVYDVPHFDFHFYMTARESVHAIRVGPCGEFIHCDDLETARMPVPTAYVAPDYVEVGAAVGRMGNHLIHSASAEFAKPPSPFTHTFIYGIYAGRITFLEPMITHEFLSSRPNVCVPITQPAAWELAGHYPTEYCIRQLSGEDLITVSLEKFVYRHATAISDEETGEPVKTTASSQAGG